MTIRLLQNVADATEGAVIEMDDRRAQRLIRTGYAEAVQVDRPAKKKAKE